MKYGDYTRSQKGTIWMIRGCYKGLCRFGLGYVRFRCILPQQTIKWTRKQKGNGNWCYARVYRVPGYLEGQLVGVDLRRGFRVYTGFGVDLKQKSMRLE